MHMIKLRKHMLTIALAVSAGLVAGTAHAYSVYRSVTADGGGVVIWNAGNFGVSGAPVPTLSFFHYADDNAARAGMPAAQCFVKVDLGALIAPVPGTVIAVGNVAIPVNGAPGDNPRAFPWNIIFDNVPPGHWSIAKTEIQNPVSTNAAASRVAAAGFQSLATTGGSGVTVINGILPNCAAQ